MCVSYREVCYIKQDYQEPPQLAAPMSPSTHYGYLYQEKLIKLGFKANGNSKCETVTVAMGSIATKSVILQSYGTKLAFAKTIIAVIPNKLKAIENLNL